MPRTAVCFKLRYFLEKIRSDYENASDDAVDALLYS